ncbi:MAG: hypothetical protein ACP5OU_02410 [Methanothrix sp.]
MRNEANVLLRSRPGLRPAAPPPLAPGVAPHLAALGGPGSRKAAAFQGRSR